MAWDFGFLSLLLLLLFFLHEAAAIFVLLSTQALCPGPALQLVPNSLLFSAPKNVDIQLCCHFMYKYIFFYDLGRKTEKERRATSEGGGRSGKSIWLRNTLLAIGRVWFVFCSNAGETPPVRSWKTGKTWRDATEKARAGMWEQTGRNIREKETKLRLIYLENSSPIAAKFYTSALSVSIGFFFLSMTDLGGQIQTRETRKREGERRSC